VKVKIDSYLFVPHASQAGTCKEKKTKKNAAQARTSQAAQQQHVRFFFNLFNLI